MGLKEIDVCRKAGINNDGWAGGTADRLLNHRLSESNDRRLELHLEVGNQGLTSDISSVTNDLNQRR
jgi:hypothetical protein